MLQRIGFDGDEGEKAEYRRWLGRRHPRRIWGEVVSNATAVLIEVVTILSIFRFLTKSSLNLLDSVRYSRFGICEQRHGVLFTGKYPQGPVGESEVSVPHLRSKAGFEDFSGAQRTLALIF